jgi:uncharacterized protein YjbJ (UPF0337 family)
MNRNQVEGAKDVADEVQRKVGELTGNENQQAKATAKQVEARSRREWAMSSRHWTRQTGRRAESRNRGVDASERTDNGQD